ncbi:hypothetical protein [Mycoplasma buteonis]|uniref:hypothetical protein n=1 Tax=Mycoplasma buteonis TaxID=171280 RepID=UPI00056A08AA|nr:hypothetical protein [Mycoplasma buteonis]
MKRIFKKRFLLTLGAATAAAMPLSMVSCLYDDSTYVKYGHSYVAKNGLSESVRPKIKASELNNPSLIEFQDKLYSAKNLTFNYSTFNWVFGNNVYNINNNFANYYYKDVIKITGNQTYEVITKEKVAEQSKNAADYEKYIKPILDEFTAAVTAYFDAYKSSKKPEFDELSLWQITRATFSPNDEAAKRIYQAYAQSQIVSYMLFKEGQAPTQEATINKVVLNAILDTPFLADYLIKQSHDEADKRFIIKNGEGNFIFKDPDYITHNGTPTVIFKEFLDSVFKKYQSYQPENANADDILTLWYNQLQHSVFRYDNENGMENGAALAFGPIHLLRNKSNNSDSEDDNYKIFEKAMDSELSIGQIRDFSINPLEFMKHNPGLWYMGLIKKGQSYFTVDSEIQKAESNLNRAKEELNSKNNASNKKIYDRRVQELNRLNTTKREILPEITKMKAYQVQIDQLVKLIENLKENAERNQAKITEETAKLNKIYAEVDKYIKSTKYIKNDLIRISEIIKREEAKTFSNEFSLNQIFARSLFAAGVYHVQIIRGTDTTTNEVTYWVEYKNGNTWKLIQPKVLLNEKFAFKKEPISNFIQTTKPANLQIDSIFENYAHVK